MARVMYISPQQPEPPSLSLLSHSVTTINSLEEALKQLDHYDAVIVGGHVDLAWARPVCTALSKARDLLPLLLLIQPSALALINTEWGFTDFAMGDAQPAEISLRLTLLLHINEQSGLLISGPVRIDETAYSAFLAGEPLDLTYTEFELLRYLAQNEGRVLTREILLSQVWGYDYYGGTRTVDVHIRRLRAKLGQHDYIISTVRNVGYRFSPHRDGGHERE